MLDEDTPLMKRIRRRLWSNIDFSNPDGCWPIINCARKAGYQPYKGPRDFIVGHYGGRGVNREKSEIFINACGNRICARPSHLTVTKNVNKLERTIFWMHVDKKDSKSCWIWKGPTVIIGGVRYGVFKRLSVVKGQRRVYVHRFSYEMAMGRPLRKYPMERVKQTCRNLLCVNPAHLHTGEHTFDTSSKRKIE